MTLEGFVKFVILLIHVMIGKSTELKWVNQMDVLESCGPRREKTCLLGFRQIKIHTGLLRDRDQLKNQNFARSQSRYDTFQ